jgi:hypothetical protein
MLRYVWNTEHEAIYETVTAAEDPHSIYKSFDVGGSEDELAEYALESISEYTRSYRDDIDACAMDWTPVFAALTGYEASDFRR